MKGTVIIMRGVPGSGKSTLSEALALSGAVIHSTDNYHIVNGVYRFSKTMLHEYHVMNYHAFCESVDKGEKVIIVDNTNFKPSLYRDYIEYAKENDYKVIAFVFKPNTIELHMTRNTHGVPLETLTNMHTVLLQNLETIGADYNYIVEVK